MFLLVLFFAPKKRTDFPGITNPHIRLSGITNPAERDEAGLQIPQNGGSFLYIEK